MNLTDKALGGLRLPEGKGEQIVFDDHLPGFGLRLRSGGASRWIFQYKLGARHRRITLGSAKALSAAQARKTANELHARVRLGHDPAGEKAEGRVRAAETVGTILKAYLQHQKTRVGPLTYVGIERHLLKHCKPLHGLQLTKVTRRNVASRLSAITIKSGPVEANRVRSSLAAFYAWSIRQGLTDQNPVIGTDRHEERSRERVLSDDELRAIWAATAGDDDYSAVVRLLMLTGQRANEIAALRRPEIRDERIVLPPERVKNGREHIVPMSAAVRKIVENRPDRPGREFVFGRRLDRPLSGWSVLKTALDQRIRDNGASVAAWTHHDLRRTFATQMAELGLAPPHIIEALLNHVSGHKRGVAGIYNRASYEREKQHAMTAWAEHIESLTGGDKRSAKVVKLRRQS